MNVSVNGQGLNGTTAIIASKSAVHRLLICAALCQTPTVIRGVTYSEDIRATISCLQASLADVECNGDQVTVTPRVMRTSDALLDCGESGSTLRFLLPVMAALGGARFTGRGRLSARPLTPVYPVLTEHGCTLSEEGRFPLLVGGRLSGNVFEIDGGLSSQFVSGLLMAAPLLADVCHIRVLGEMASYPYIAMTIEALSQFGITVTQNDRVFTVSGRYTTVGTVSAEGDWSNAAFWLVGAAISGSDAFAVSGISETSLQGDRAIVSLLQQAGFSVNGTNGCWRVSGGEHRRALRVDAEAIPDLVPIVSVLATCLPGQTVIYNAERLIHKESNRLQSVHDMLTALGGKVSITADGLTVDGGALTGGTIDAFGDHRIVMSAAIASLVCREAVTITGAHAVKKSYPTFFEEIAKKGMSVCHLFGEEN